MSTGRRRTPLIEPEILPPSVVVDAEVCRKAAMRVLDDVADRVISKVLDELYDQALNGQMAAGLWCESLLVEGDRCSAGLLGQVIAVRLEARGFAARVVVNSRGRLGMTQDEPFLQVMWEGER